MAFCYHDGHEVRHQTGDYCPVHGARLFDQCMHCGAGVTRVQIGYGVISAADFCSHCGLPAPWVSRKKRLAWLKDRLHEEGLDAVTELDLRELLDRLVTANPDDSRTLAAWQRIRDTAPKLWRASGRVLETIIAEKLKDLL